MLISIKRVIGSTFLVGSLTACSFSDIVGAPKSDESVVTNPDAIKSPTGALSFYRGATLTLGAAAAFVAKHGGIFADELRNDFSGVQSVQIDIRRITDSDATDNSTMFTRLQEVRANARQARGALFEYAPASPKDLVAHLYATEAMANVLLAETYCSGIPLSTVDYGRDFTLKPGLFSEMVYMNAVALFDSAIALALDSARIRHFAAVGKARALINLGRYVDAAKAVTDVPDAYVYRFEPAGFGRLNAQGIYSSSIVMSDGEGINGLRFATQGDARTDTVRNLTQPTPPGAFRYYIPQKQSDIQGRSPIVLADGIEARLIEAEAELAADHVVGWLVKLNRLRTSCEIGAPCSTPAPAGGGGVNGLSLLTDPAVDVLPTGKTANDVRIDLMFKERAYWMFLTAHRLGDLRRLVRQYGRKQEDVFPNGVYIARFGFSYGTDVNFPIPDAEKQRNSLFEGCIDREA